MIISTFFVWRLSLSLVHVLSNFSINVVIIEGRLVHYYWYKILLMKKKTGTDSNVVNCK